MKKVNINVILQIIALVFLIIIFYFSFQSSSNLKVIAAEVDNAKEELKTSKETITTLQKKLENTETEFKKMRAQKDLIIHKRDSLIFAFRKKNAKDWEELVRIKDSIKFTNDQLIKDRLLLDRLFGLDQ
ncbi:hypothetical protein [Tenacibaculum amylolyticum]|uniref:hypothetical protein n=1 Tax=Tenacibaculum amylolyticum TaxID=104269 RepID=UPI0038962101